MGKNSNAPDPDPAIGRAAEASAANGRDALAFMKQQAGITNAWAQQDRDRQQDTFIPLQDAFIKDAQEWASPERTAARVDQNRAAVSTGINTAQGMQDRQMLSMGISPTSGKSRALAGGNTIKAGLALAGATNQATDAVRAEAEAKKAEAINLGAGLAINPATSMGLSNGAAQAGFGAAQAGYGQQADIYNAQYRNQLSAYDANQQSSSDLWSGIGSIAGLAFGGAGGGAGLSSLAFLSSKKLKTGKTAPGRSLLDAVDKMPVEKWTYKAGKGDGGTHIGPYAEDFHKHTGMGDGKTINVIDSLGVNQGAIRELHAKVRALERSIPGVHRAAEDKKPQEGRKMAPLRATSRVLPQQARAA